MTQAKSGSEMWQIGDKGPYKSAQKQCMNVKQELYWDSKLGRSLELKA